MQGWPRNFNKMYFELIGMFIFFQSSHSSDLTDLENDICYLPHLNFASCEDFEFNKKLNNEETLERNAFPFVVRDPTLHYVETFHEDNT